MNETEQFIAELFTYQAMMKGYLKATAGSVYGWVELNNEHYEDFSSTLTILLIEEANRILGNQPIAA